jgi:hypothetical protein
MAGSKVETAVQWKAMASGRASASRPAADSSDPAIASNSASELPRSGSRVTTMPTSGGSMARSSGSATALPEGTRTPRRARSP